MISVFCLVHITAILIRFYNNKPYLLRASIPASLFEKIEQLIVSPAMAAPVQLYRVALHLEGAEDTCKHLSRLAEFGLHPSSSPLVLCSAPSRFSR